MNIKECAAWLNEHDDILILTHIRPDGDTLGRFRNLLIKNGLQEKLFSQVVAALMERGLILKKGTIVDSTIISAPSSTKNKEKKRDPDAHQVKKGNTWHFGYRRL